MRFPSKVTRSTVYTVEAAGLLAVMALFACIPVDWASGLGGMIGRSIGPHLRASRRAMKNLQRVMPDNSKRQNAVILRGMWDNLGRSMAEYPHLSWICSEHSGRVEIVNGDGILSLLADVKPGILFGGHFSNWEVGPSTIHRLMGASLLSVYRAANNPWVNAVQRRLLRTRHAIPKGRHAGRDVLLHLRRGGHVGLLVDQKQNDGIAVPFLGHIAMTAPGVARLSRHFECPVVPIHTERLGGAHFRLTVMPPLETQRSADPKADEIENMNRVNEVIASWVRARPAQWLWLHRRWAN